MGDIKMRNILLVFIVFIVIGCSIILIPQLRYKYQVINLEGDLIVFYNKAYTKNNVGLITKKGKVIFEPKYQSIDIKNEKFIVLRDKQKKIIVRKDKPKEEIYTTANEVQVFRDYLLVNGEVDYLINGDGKIIQIDQNYDIYIKEYNSEQLFYLDRLAVKHSSGKWGFIDSSGKTVIEPKYDYATNFVYYNNYAIVINDGYKLIDNKDKTVLADVDEKSLKTNYEKSQHPWYGFSVHTKDEKRGIWDQSTNSYIVEPIYDSIQFINSGEAVVVKDNKRGLVNTKGQIIVEPSYEGISYYYQDVNWVAAKLNGKYGVVNLNTNETIIPFLYDGIYEKYNNIFFAIKNDKKYFVDRFGNELVEFDDVIYRSQDEVQPYLLVRKDHLIGIINTNSGKGTELIYENVFDEKNTFGVVKNRKCGYFDKDLNLIVEPKYEENRSSYNMLNNSQENKYIITKLDRKMGVIDFNNKVIINFNYDTIYRLNDHEFILEKDAKIYLANTSGKISQIRSHLFW